MRIVIIGTGRLGSKLVDIFVKHGDNILVVEQTESKFIYIENREGVEFLVGNATDEKVLRDAFRKPADIVMVVTGDDYTNILISQKIRLIDKTTRVVTRLFDTNLATIYSELGMEIVCPTSLTISTLAKMLGI
ncbi:MAG: NAD-binding protein [Deltaproteobacteria bacterium]|nr:NAD-binding protein [Deltaproteobacteria bacterium]